MKPSAIIITGCGRRLGRELALAAASKGFAVVGHYRRSRREVAALRKDVEALGSALFPLAWDFEKGTEGFIARCRQFPVRIEALVNNASIFEKGDFLSLAAKGRAWRRQLEINAFAPLALSLEFARQVGRGVIINMLDAGADRFHRPFQIYRLSKRLLAEFTRDCALTFAPHIRVNAIAPGILLPSPHDSSAEFKRKQRSSPLTPDLSTLSAAFHYLMAQKDVTGQTLYIDGGFHLGLSSKPKP